MLPTSISELLSNLPDSSLPTNSSLSCLYGADYVAASYCNLNRPPSLPRGIWQHGWHPIHHNFDSGVMIGSGRSFDDVRSKEAFWVARKDQELYLQEQGYLHAKAIGLPLVYLPQIKLPRIQGSLLVMPVHSANYTTHNWKFDEYADTIASLKDTFTDIVACIHPSCWMRGYWVDAFRDRDITVVKGAIASDRNALYRMQMFLSGFEFMTTNDFGSHLVYASYFGAKPSIYGSFAAYRREDYSNTPFFKHCPHLLGPFTEAVSEGSMRQHFPFLFCDPQNATELRAWGKEQIGEPCKVSSQELRRLFGWDKMATIKGKLHRLQSKSALVKHRFSAALGDIPVKNCTLRDFVQFPKITKLPPHTPGSATIQGKSFEFVDRTAFLYEYNEVIRKQILRFATTDLQPYIIDGGANIGLNSLYLKNLYPNAHITAFEPDPIVFEVLQRNCQTFGLQNVKLFQEALHTETTTSAVSLKEAPREGLAHGEKQTPLGDYRKDKMPESPTRRLRDLLETYETITFLKLDIKGVETEVIEDCADILKKIKYIFVRYYSLVDRPQTLHRLLLVIHNAGFRVYLNTHNPSPQPLFLREIKDGKNLTDLSIDIWCYRRE